MADEQPPPSISTLPTPVEIKYSEQSTTQTMVPPVAKRAPPTRQKVPLRPGYHLSDWRRLVQSGKDLSGTGGVLRRVTAEEVRC